MDIKSNELLEDIALEETSSDLGINREILGDIELRKDMVLTIQGVRRSGKSIFMKQIINHNSIESESIYINFEDPRLSDRLDYKLLDQIVEFHEQKKFKNY